MRRIELTRGMFAVVDSCDYEYLNQWKWQAVQKRHCYYAVRQVGGARIQQSGPQIPWTKCPPKHSITRPDPTNTEANYVEVRRMRPRV
jgi:hypothetical protein